jgi:hypothetical protein
MGVPVSSATKEREVLLSWTRRPQRGSGEVLKFSE